MRRESRPGIEVLADDTRRAIVALLASHPHRPTVLAQRLGLARSTVTHHLRALEAAGLVRLLPFSTEDRVRLYALDPDSTGRVVAWLAGTRIGVPDSPASAPVVPGPADDRTSSYFDHRRTHSERPASTQAPETADVRSSSKHLRVRRGGLPAHSRRARRSVVRGRQPAKQHGGFLATSQEALRKPASNTPMAATAPGPNPTGAHVLVVDDEPAIRDLLATALRYMGYQVTTAESGHAALEAAATLSPELVVLDVMLPDLDGFEVCRRLRERDFVPVIFLSARDTEDDRVTGFVRGGDDYVTKPFSLEELTLRIGALLRRVKGTNDGAPRLRYRDLEMDEDRHQVWRATREVDLSPTEFRLLRYF